MVLVSHQHRFIYLKTRKAAGTSLEMALEPFCMAPDHVPKHGSPERVTLEGIVGMRLEGMPERSTLDKLLGRNKVRWYNHMAARKVRKGLGRRDWDRYAKIAAVRNPFDRMVSYFHWLRAGADASDLAVLREAFRAFVASEEWSDDFNTTHVDGAYVVDHAVRYECLSADLGAVVDALGLDATRVHLPKTKMRKKKRQGLPVSAYFDDETQEVVRRRMAWMFERIGYSTDLADADARLVPGG